MIYIMTASKTSIMNCNNLAKFGNLSILNSSLIATSLATDGEENMTRPHPSTSLDTTSMFGHFVAENANYPYVMMN